VDSGEETPVNESEGDTDAGVEGADLLEGVGAD
jgi:hypothetical protein